MTLGPFHNSDAENIAKILTELKITFERRVDEELIKHKMDESNQVISYLRGVSFDPSVIFFEIAEEDAIKIGNHLEKFGVLIGEAQTTDVEDWLCPKCTYRSENPGFCHKHNTKLLDYSAWLELKKKRYSFLKVFFSLLLAAITIVVYFL